METLTLQIYNQPNWQDIATLKFINNFKQVQLSYLPDYIPLYFSENNCHAVSINYPVDFYFENTETGWLALLDDIMPSGASRKYWVKVLDIAHLPTGEQNYLLLKYGTIAPVGNLRVKEAIEAVPMHKPRLFPLDEVKNRAVDFLEYANQQGAMAGGATGAGGEAPKLLLRCNSEQVWIDNQQTLTEPDDYYLVKYPRGNRTAIDCDILRAEFHYYHELTAMGFNTIETQNMRLEEGEHYPSLWLPRFDIDKQTKRYAVESVYSMLQKGAGAFLDHNETIIALITKINQTDLEFDSQDFVIKWLKRDLLNIAFGNSDNHGRNTAFLRDENKIWLAPIYDFAPMKADPEGIIRTLTWDRKSTPPKELGGEYDFEQITQSLSEFIEPDQLLKELKITANQLVGLKSRLELRGVPKSILNFPAIGFDYLEEKLQRWGLIE